MSVGIWIIAVVSVRVVHAWLVRIRRSLKGMLKVVSDVHLVLEALIFKFLKNLFFEGSHLLLHSFLDFFLD